MSTITIRIPDKLDPIIEEFCKEKDRSKSSLIKKALKEKLEKWHNIKIFLKGRTEYEKNLTHFLEMKNFGKKSGIKNNQNN